MAIYKVRLLNRVKRLDKTVNVDDTEYILEAVENLGMELPYSCRAGACATCAGKLTAGKVDQSSQSYLCDDSLKAGYVLLCVAKPLSDCVIETHCEFEASIGPGGGGPSASGEALIRGLKALTETIKRIEGKT